MNNKVIFIILNVTDYISAPCLKWSLPQVYGRAQLICRCYIIWGHVICYTDLSHWFDMILGQIMAPIQHYGSYYNYDSV